MHELRKSTMNMAIILQNHFLITCDEQFDSLKKGISHLNNEFYIEQVTENIDNIHKTVILIAASAFSEDSQNILNKTYSFHINKNLKTFYLKTIAIHLSASFFVIFPNFK